MKIEAKELERKQEFKQGDVVVSRNGDGMEVIVTEGKPEFDSCFCGTVLKGDGHNLKGQYANNWAKSDFKPKRGQQQEFKPIEVRLTLETEEEFQHVTNALSRVEMPDWWPDNNVWEVYERNK